jgi:hypothetical protein
MPRLWPETDGFLEQWPQPGYRFVVAQIGVRETASDAPWLA